MSDPLDSSDGIAFRCPQCGAVSTVARDLAGTASECPRCGCPITIPAADTPGAPAPRMSPPTETRFQSPPTGENRQGVAVAALVFAILGFCFGPLAFIAIVLAIIALVRVSKRPMVYGGGGLAVAGLLCAFASLVIQVGLIAILVPSLARARELSMRAACSANLKGMGTGFYTYANENADDWPIALAPHPDYVDGQNTGLVDYTAAIGSYRGRESDPTAGDTARMAPLLPDRLSTTRNLYTLVRLNVSTPKSFICPSSGDMTADEDSPQDFWDFGRGDATGPVDARQAAEFWSLVSYGYQVPYGNHGRPSCDRDVNMALVADKGPFGANLDAGLPAPGPITAGPQSTPDQWQRWNSPNHGGPGSGEGQNVLFADGHAEWSGRPNCGVKGDNIYTQWSNMGVLPQHRSQGNPPTKGGRQVPVGDTDSLIYP